MDTPNDLFEELKKEIVIERLKAMPQNIKIALGSDGKFLDKEKMLKEVNGETNLGKKIIKIQFEYLKSFKEGLPE